LARYEFINSLRTDCFQKEILFKIYFLRDNKDNNMDNLIDKTVTDIKMLPTLDQMGLVNSTTVEVNPQRQVGSDSFNGNKDKWTKGLIDLQFNINGQKRWVPSKSYFKATATLTVNGLPPVRTDKIAFAESFMTNLIASCSFYIGNVCVSRMDDYVGQAMMLTHRCGRSLNWLSTIGKDVYFLQPDWTKRNQLTSADGSLDEIPYPFVVDTEDPPIAYQDTNRIYASTGAIGFYLDIGNPPAPGGFPVIDTAWNVGDIITWTPDSPPGVRYSTKVTGVVNNGNQGWLVTEDVITVSDNPETFLTREVTQARDLEIGDSVNDQRNKIQVCFQLPLGIFNSESSILPAGEYRFKITPKSDKIGAIQTENINFSTGVAGNWDVTINDFKLVNTIFYGNTNFGDGDFYLPLNEWELQNKKLNGGASLTSHNFTVPQTTHTICMFAQDTAAGSIDAPNIPPSVFRT